MAAVLRGPSNLSIARLPCSSLLLISLKKVTRNLSVLPAYEKPLEATDDLVEEHIFTQQHMEMRHAFRKLIEKDINPYVDQWEKEECIPTHKLFKKLGDAGFLGVNKPVEYGGLGLDYTYAIAVQEELGENKIVLDLGLALYGYKKYANVPRPFTPIKLFSPDPEGLKYSNFTLSNFLPKGRNCQSVPCPRNSCNQINMSN